MTSEQDTLCDRIRNRLNLLRREPVNYRQGVPGTRTDLPNNLMMLHRYPGRKIFEQETRVLYNPRYVLTLNLKSSGVAGINGKTFPFPELHAQLTYPFQTHFYMVDQEQFDWLVITFESEKALSPALMYRSVYFRPELLPLADRLLTLYLNCESGGAPEGTASLMQIYLELILNELMLEKQFIEADSKEVPLSDAFRLFERLNSYVYANLADPGLSLRKIAAAHYISLIQLHRLFRRHADSTPGRYIRQCRLQKAVRMLNERTHLIAEIASQCGFDSAAAFSRCFRHEFSIPPSEYPGDHR